MKGVSGVFLFFCLLVSAASAQKKLTEQTINWQPPRHYRVQPDAHHHRSGQYYHFEHARYFNHQTLLPYYYTLIPLNQPHDYRVKLANQQFRELNRQVQLNDAARKSLEDQVIVDSRLSYERNRPYLQVKFVPIRKNPSTGTLEGLEQFDLILEAPPDDLKKSYGEVPAPQTSAEPSPLLRGEWVKLRIDETGVYRLSYSTLKDIGVEEPASVAVYGNHTGVLNTDNQTTPSYRLHPVPVYVEKGKDGQFGKGDHVFFFGRSPDQWEYLPASDRFVHRKHPYTDYNYYYLNVSGDDAGESVDMLDQPSGTAEVQVRSFPDYRHYEEDRHNLIQSGRRWFGTYFDVSTAQSYDFQFPNIKKDEPVRVWADFASRSAAASSFALYNGDNNLFTTPIRPVSYTFTGYYARMGAGSGSFLADQDELTLTLEYQKGTPSAEGWLNAITLNAVRQLRMTGKQMLFRYKASDPGTLARLHIEDVQADAKIWEVTQRYPTQRIGDIDKQGDQWSFTIRGDTLYREFIAFNPEKTPAPKVMGKVEKQNLHGMGPKNMVIVTKEKFDRQASRLAQMHRRRDGFKVGVVSDREVYNEFSAGKPDPAAIRNFVRMIYRKSTPRDSLKYLLLLGDGSYNNRESANSPFLITYQSEESLHYSRSFVSDDFFGLLDRQDDIEADFSGLMDIGVGRLPVTEVAEARQVVDKIDRYMNRENWGPWLNRICFVADDQDNNLHMRDADKLAQQVASNHPQFNIEKVYFDAYPQQITASGATYPEVSREINEQINNGILLFNYTGHGGERHLAHERVLTKEDIASWRNDSRLPLFMTATCEFTRFDDPDFTSAGEKVFLKPDGGSIASFSTTRLVYASLNYELNRVFYQYVFRKDRQGKPMRLGDVVRLTKKHAGTSNNKRNFSLFGDPALQMPLGQYQVQTDSITPGDTLQALDRVKLHGSVRGNNGSLARDFDGTLHLRVYDKKRQRQTLNNDQQTPFSYETRDNLLFSGKSRVSQGRFTSEWVVPRDLLPEIRQGKMIYFAHSGSRLARGYYRDYLVGGFSQRQLNDSKGPSIDLYMNDKQFVSGGITHQNPTLIATLTDSSGINTTRSGAGHDITMTLDNDPQKQYVLNSYYQASENAYQRGKLTYQLSDLDKGRHELQLKAWDINNNPSSTSISFTVSASDELKINKVLNYPNPFTEQTAFYFEHNRPGTLLDVRIQILSVSGQLVKTIHRQIQTSGFRAGPIQWNGRDDFGDRIGRGVYLYKLKARSPSGQTAEKIQKLVILK